MKGKKLVQCAFCFSSCTKQQWCCSTITNFQVPEFWSFGRLTCCSSLGAYRYNYFSDGLYLLHCAKSWFSSCYELCLPLRTEVILSRFLRSKDHTREKGVMMGENKMSLLRKKFQKNMCAFRACLGMKQLSKIIWCVQSSTFSK